MGRLFEGGDYFNYFHLKGGVDYLRGEGINIFAPPKIN